MHQNIYQEIAALAFILQEASNPDSAEDGSRIGLDEQGILSLLKKVIRLKIDTLSLLADMQIERGWRAMRKAPLKKNMSKRKPIISEKKFAEDDKRREKELKQAKNWGFASARQRGEDRRGETRRPRFPITYQAKNAYPKGYPPLNRRAGAGEPNFQVSFNGRQRAGNSAHKGFDTRNPKAGGFRTGKKGAFRTQHGKAVSRRRPTQRW